MISPFKSIATLVHKGMNIVPSKYRNKHVVFGIAMAALTLDNLNVAGAMTTSFSIQEVFNTDYSTASWVLSAYALTLGAFIIIFGKIGDMWGAHNVFLLGLIFMCFFSLLTAIPQKSIIAMIIFRAFQGIGAAALVPNGYSMAANYFQGPELEKAIQILVVAVTASMGLGAVLGGAFSTTSIGYMGFFYFTFAVSFICSVLLFLLSIPIERTEEQKFIRMRDLDFPGVLMLVTGLLLIITALTESSTTWKTPKVYVILPIGCILLVLMLLFESYYLTNYKRTHNQAVCASNSIQIPRQQCQDLEKQGKGGFNFLSTWMLNVELIFPAAVFKIPNLIPLVIGISMAFFNFTTALMILIQYHIYEELDSPLMAAVKILPFPVGLVISTMSYRESQTKKLGMRNMLLISSLALVGCSVWLSRTDYTVPNDYWKTRFVSQFILGFAINRFFMVYLNCIMASTPLDLQGLVAGIFNTFGQIFVALASAIVATILGTLEGTSSDSKILQSQYHRFHNAFYATIASAVVYFIFMLMIKDPYKKVEKSEQNAEIELCLTTTKETEE